MDNTPPISTTEQNNNKEPEPTGQPNRTEGEPEQLPLEEEPDIAIVSERIDDEASLEGRVPSSE
jgi:hypothetical protein